MLVESERAESRIFSLLDSQGRQRTAPTCGFPCATEQIQRAHFNPIRSSFGGEQKSTSPFLPYRTLPHRTRLLHLAQPQPPHVDSPAARSSRIRLHSNPDPIHVVIECRLHSSAQRTSDLNPPSLHSLPHLPPTPSASISPSSNLISNHFAPSMIPLSSVSIAPMPFRDQTKTVDPIGRISESERGNVRPFGPN